jgi:PhzF family phenazine biosynthesis protein
MTSSSNRFQVFQADAFTDAPFGGNPAAVVLLPYVASLPSHSPFSDAQMLAIADEMNLSETAFVQVWS